MTELLEIWQAVQAFFKAHGELAIIACMAWLIVAMKRTYKARLGRCRQKTKRLERELQAAREDPYLERTL